MGEWYTISYLLGQYLFKPKNKDTKKGRFSSVFLACFEMVLAYGVEPCYRAVPYGQAQVQSQQEKTLAKRSTCVFILGCEQILTHTLLSNKKCKRVN